MIAITKDGATNNIIASMEFALTAFPIAEGYSHAEIIEIQDRPEFAMRRWRDEELKDSDWIVQIPDHPEKAAYTTYRAALRSWPSDSDNFPDTRPELGE